MIGVAALALGGSAPANAALVGLSDQQPATFNDERVRALPLDHARLIVPWDVALTNPVQVDDWLAATRAASLKPLVSFQHGVGDRCPDAPCFKPSQSEFADAFTVFRSRWPQVAEFTAWNEPNHPIEPVASDAVRAAAYHDALRATCPSCTVAAGDFVDNAAMKTYFTAYRDALKQPVQAWAVHNYGDLIYDRPSYVEWLLARTTAPLWLTETGGIVSLRNERGEFLIAEDEARAGRSMVRLVELLRAQSARITRAYVYHWRADPLAEFDAGLTRSDGTARPAFDVLAEFLGPRPAPDRDVGGGDTGPGGDGPPAAGPAAPAPSPSVTGGVLGPDAAAGARPAERRVARKPGPAIGRPRIMRGGWRVPVRCPPAVARRRGCRGRVTLIANARVVGSARFVARGTGWKRVTVRQRARRARGQALRGIVVIDRAGGMAERTWNPGGDR